MHIIDLTLPITIRGAHGAEVRHDRTAIVAEDALEIEAGPYRYTALLYAFHFGSMAGTYIDLPGHIRATADGMDAANCPAERFYRLPAVAIHLDRPDRSGGISAAELEAACPCEVEGNALVVNALGTRRFDAIENRSVWLTKDAAAWIVSRGVHLLVSDVYESDSDPQNVFTDLFAAGVSTVCLPVNLHLLAAPRGRVTVLFVRLPGVTQVPCRIVAEWD